MWIGKRLRGGDAGRPRPAPNTRLATASAAIRLPTSVHDDRIPCSTSPDPVFNIPDSVLRFGCDVSCAMPFWGWFQTWSRAATCDRQAPARGRRAGFNRSGAGDLFRLDSLEVGHDASKVIGPHADYLSAPPNEMVPSTLMRNWLPRNGSTWRSPEPSSRRGPRLFTARPI